MTSSSDQAGYERDLRALHEEFVASNDLQQSLEELADAALELILAGERLRAGVADDPRLSSLVDLRTLSMMRQWDSNDPGMLMLEKVLRRLAGGRGVAALELLQTAVEARKKALSISQSAKAKQPRSQHPVTILIDEIVAAEPTITRHLLLRKLKGLVGGDVINTINSIDIEPTDPEFGPLKVSGLKDMLSRAKKKHSQ
jgi:hypothetical protein